MTLVAAARLGKDFRPPVAMCDLARLRLRPETVAALDDVTLEVAAGEAVAVLGANGAGKSTLLRCLAGLLVPSRGRAEVAGHDCAVGGAALRAAAAYVASDPRSFAWRLSGRANLAFFAGLFGYRGSEARRRVEEVLDMVGLAAGDRGRRVAEYSSGMRQRLTLARAFLGQPRVLLLDEPTGGLDPRAAGELLGLLRAKVRSGCAAVVVTHLREEAASLADRAIVLERGRLVFAGSPAAAWEAAGGTGGPALREAARG